MPFQRFSRTVFNARSLALAALVALFGAVPAAPAMAQQHNSIFPAGWDNTVRDRLFMRIGYVSVSTTTKSEEVRDITGYAVTRADVKAATDLGIACSDGSNTASYCARYDDKTGGLLWGAINTLLNGDPSSNTAGSFDYDHVDGIGTPSGVKARAQKQAGTPALSIGYWLDEDRHWLVEGFVLAQPISIKLYGDGVRQGGSFDCSNSGCNDSRPNNEPNTINGRHIATTKLLPPLVIGSYNFGNRDAIVRPYVGLGVMYAVFFDGQATPFLDAYVGGKTTISTRNTFGAGPFVGLQSPINEDWHVNLSVGQIGLRTTSRLVTSNTSFKSGADVFNDLSPNLTFAIKNGDDLFTNPQNGDLPVAASTLLTELVARNKGQSSLGTFVREQKMRIKNTIVNVSVGRSF